MRLSKGSRSKSYLHKLTFIRLMLFSTLMMFNSLRKFSSMKLWTLLKVFFPLLANLVFLFSYEHMYIFKLIYLEMSKLTSNLFLVSGLAEFLISILLGSLFSSFISNDSSMIDFIICSAISLFYFIQVTNQQWNQIFNLLITFSFLILNFYQDTDLSRIFFIFTSRWIKYQVP